MVEKQPFVAVLECANGNGVVGSMWVETAIFPPTATVAEVHAWAKSKPSGGRLIITVASDPKPEEMPF